MGNASGPTDRRCWDRSASARASAAGYPRWGYSNAAGAFRAELWRERHFREDLPGAEDKEWAASGRWPAAA